MERTSPAVEFLANAVVRVSDGLRQFGRRYLAVLFSPGDALPAATSGTEWWFPLTVIVGYSLLQAVMLRIAWPAMARGIGLSAPLAAARINVAMVFIGGVVFWFMLSIVTLLCVRVLGREPAGWLSATSCVAAAIVPLSALTVAGWVVLYLSPALSLLVMLFGLLAGFGYFVEAVRNQYNLSVEVSLYAIPLMVVAALFLTGLLVLVVEIVFRSQTGTL